MKQELNLFETLEQSFSNERFLAKLAAPGAPQFLSVRWEQVLAPLLPIEERLTCAQALACFRPLLDAMAEENLRTASKPRLRFTGRVAEALTRDGISNLAQAKAAHDRLEALYNPHVNFDGVYTTSDKLAEEIIGQ